MQVERDSSQLAPAADFLLFLSSFPFGLGLGEEGGHRAMRVVSSLPAWEYLRMKVNVLVIVAFPFQLEYIKMQPSSCANPQAIEIKGFKL